ncbi:2-amino-4-hydroxy-6-hydroxymethyldihydropteridine diphosphokinase [Paenirhodobacter sp.]|uniref:2-amino-4-hydroxy-6- hydroxymethyldihydropteridine diphosphokinase n=1 Tax=Paenirhodobacter sp. TaxID=1965326 RepID=UPI003D10A53E
MANTMFVIALGSNLPSAAGGSAQSLAAALGRFAGEGLALRALSRFWRSPAFPAGSGPDFVNACALAEGEMTPEAALAALHRIEAALGRERHARWAARGIDLDLIAAEGAIRPDPAVQAEWRALPLEAQMRRAPETLILPHPRLQDRAFVLIPLAEIAPGWCDPVSGRSVAQMLAALPEAEKAALQPFAAPFATA